jgi:hypothetical protein
VIYFDPVAVSTEDSYTGLDKKLVSERLFDGLDNEERERQSDATTNRAMKFNWARKQQCLDEE